MSRRGIAGRFYEEYYMYMVYQGGGKPDPYPGW